MPTYEEEIKEALIIQQTTDACEMMREPVYQQFIRDFARDLVNNIKKNVFTGTDAQENEFIAKKLNPDTIYANMMNDETKMRANAYQNARGQLMLSKADAELAFNTRQLLPNGDDEESREVAAAFKPILDKFFNDLAPLFQFNSALVAELAKIAQISGMEKAVIRETVNRAIRKLAPTADDYIAMRQKQVDSGAELIANVQTVIASFTEGEEDDEELRMIRTTFSTIIQSLGTQLVKDGLRRQAQKIYG